MSYVEGDQPKGNQPKAKRKEIPKPGPGPNAPNRDAPLGYHVNKDGDIVRNKGRQDGNRGGGGAGGGPGGGGPGEGGPGGGGPTGEGPPPIPAQFLQKLKDAGLHITKNGKIAIIGRDSGAGAGEQGTQEQLALIQQAYERFGLAENPFYDPRLILFSGEMHTGSTGREQGLFIDLGTGSFANDTSMTPISDERLAFLQQRAGYDPAYAFEHFQQANTYTRPDGSVYTASAFQTPEAFAAYQAAARANYLSEGTTTQQQANTEPTTPSDDMGFGPVLEQYDTPTLSYLSETTANMLKARENRGRAQSFYGDYFSYGDLFGEEEV